MSENNRITSAEMILLIVGSRLMFAYTYMPILNTPPHNQDAWIVAVLSAVYSVVMSVPVLFLVIKFRGIGFDGIAETVLGKAAGKTFLLLFALFFWFCCAACTLLAIIFINNYLFLDTPSWILLAFLAIPSLYAALKGAGTIARVSFFIVPYILLTIVIFLLLSLDQLDYSILLPVLADSGFRELNEGGVLTAGYFSEALVLFVFSVYLNPKANIVKIYMKSILLFTVAFIVMVIPTLTLLGLDISRHAWNPYYFFTRQVTAFGFIQRVESLNVIAWFLGVLIKSALFGFMSGLTLSRVFGGGSHRPYTAAVWALTAAVVLLPFFNRSDFVDMLRSYHVLPYIVLFFSLVLPTVMVAVYWLRRRKVDAAVEAKRRRRDENGSVS